MKTIPEFPKYSITEDGKVFSHETNSFLSGNGTSDRYMSVLLRKGGRSFRRYRHRLVVETYLGVIDDTNQVNHIDGNKHNNHVSNLEICSASENMKHAVATRLVKITDAHLESMRRSIGQSIARFTETDAKNIRAIYMLMPAKSCRKIARTYRCARSTIERIVTGTQQHFRQETT
jgi:hypothetical protein